MDPSPVTMEHASLEIGGASFEVVELAGEEALSRLFRYAITCSGGGDPGALVGAEARVTLSDGFGATRTITGVVAEAEERSLDEGHTMLHVVVRPRAFALTLGRSSRVFLGDTVVDIVNEVIRDKPRWDTTATYAPHAYCAQYREDDWTFVSRMLEEEGIYAWFDHEAGSALVLADTSAAAPDIEGGAAIPFAYEAGMTRGREHIAEIGSIGRVAPGRFTVGSFNPKNPRLQVRGEAGAGELEIYEAPGGGPDSPEECARQARFLAEAAACGAAGLTGVSTSVRLAPGRVVEIVGHPSSRIGGRYLVVEAHPTVVQRRRGAGGEGHEAPYRCRFRLIPQAVPFRPARVTPPARQAGVQIGVVVGETGAEVFPDAEGRVRVQHHWDREGTRDDRAGTWMRVAQRPNADSMLLPRVGWNVATFNEEGAIDAPSVLRRFHDGEHPPSYPLPANKTRVVYKTATTPGGGSFNEIHFEDKQGAERMFWNASRDMDVLVQNDDAELVVNDARRAVGRDEFTDVTGNHSTQVDGAQAVSVAKDETITVSGSSDKTVLGNEKSTVGGKRSVTAGDSHATQVAKTRKLSVGAAQVDVTLGPISAQAKTLSVLVGGALVRVTAKSMADAAGWASVQTIGVAKIETVTGARTTRVKKRLIETAGGAMLLDAGKDFADKSDKTASFKAAGDLAGDAPSIHLEAKEKITLSVGSTVITVEPKKITIASSTFELGTSSTFVVLSPKVTHN